MGFDPASDRAADWRTASQEQSAGIAGVNGALGAMDQSTQQNAALVEQAAAAAACMKDQALALAGAARRFQLPSEMRFVQHANDSNDLKLA